MRKICISFISLSLFVALATCAFAKIEVPGRTGKWVNDYAGVIDDNTKSYLEGLISSIKQKAPDPIEVIVATFESLEGWKFEDFSREYGEKWRLTRQSKRDNGVIVLIAVKDGRVGIGVGRNLERILTYPVTDDIVKKIMLPDFSKGKYSEGIKKAVEAIIEVIGKAEIPSGNPLMVLVGLLAVVCLLLAALFLFKKRN
jgi:uncharacterized protein